MLTQLGTCIPIQPVSSRASKMRNYCSFPDGPKERVVANKIPTSPMMRYFLAGLKSLRREFIIEEFCKSCAADSLQFSLLIPFAQRLLEET